MSRWAFRARFHRTSGDVACFSEVYIEKFRHVLYTDIRFVFLERLTKHYTVRVSHSKANMEVGRVLEKCHCWALLTSARITNYVMISFQYEPFIFKKIVNGTTVYEGFCIDLLEQLSQNLNFT